MANCCYFILKAKGFKSEEDQNAFMAVFSNNFGATEHGCDTSKPYMAIYAGAGTYAENGIVTAEGDCKWSVKTSMLSCGYYARERSSDDKLTCLEKLSKQYGIIIEVYSEEVGIGFQEHFVIKNGEMETEECVDYGEFFIGDSYEEFDKECRSQFAEIKDDEECQSIANWSKERWTEYFQSEGDYYRYGGFGDWIFSEVA